MKKQFVKILSLSALLVSTSLIFSSCDKDDDDGDDKTVNSAKRVYILNEGKMGSNNATLDVYYPDGKNAYQSKIFAAANGQGLGDTGQDLIAYGDRLYVSVSGSNYLAKLDQKGKIVEQYSFTETEGSPRYLAAKDGFIYVSTWGNKVMKFDTAAIVAPKGSVEVGLNPEGIAVKGNDLIVCNSTEYPVNDSTISVIDLTTFSLKKSIKAQVGNFQRVAVVGDSVYITYYTPSYSIEMLNFDVESGIVKPSGSATNMVSFDDKLYCANSATVYDADWNATINTNFFVRDVKTGKDSEFLDLTSAPELKTATVYLFEIDPDNGDFYVGAADYVTNGTIYRFDKTGKFITKFETSSVNPSHAVFVK